MTALIRVSKEDGSEEPADEARALRLLHDAYPGFASDEEILAALRTGPLQTNFAFYKMAREENPE